MNGVLFDLDGTLLDTAPDMSGSLNDLRAERGLRALPFAEVRPHVSHGSAALLRLGFGLTPGDAAFEETQRRYLEIYRGRIARETRPFPGIERLLTALEAQDLPWGVVTNKPAWLTEPLLKELELMQRASVVVSGDSTVNRKPHPEPLLVASNAIAIACERCLYVGDAARDIEAGNRAGMRTAAALFGYLGAEDSVSTWGADHAVEHPAALHYLIFGTAPA